MAATRRRRVIPPLPWHARAPPRASFSTLVANAPRTPSSPPSRFRTQRGIAVLAAGVAMGTLVTGSALFVGTAGYASYVLNRSRTRWFSDHFVLTPESLRMPYRKVGLQTEDGVQLEAWWIEQTVRGHPSDRIVLCACPYNHDKSTLLAIARALWDSGHSVLLFDFRAFGPNKPPHETIGHLELRDARAAIAWLRATKPAQARIGVMGCSMGGAVALRLVEEDDTDVVGVATDCAFANLGDVVHAYVSNSAPRIPQPLVTVFVDTVSMINSLVFGYRLEHVGPEMNLHKLKVPLYVLHSAQDSIVPLSQAYKIVNGAATPSEHRRLLVVDGIDHIGSFFTDSLTYTKNLVGFLDYAFGRDGAAAAAAAGRADGAR